MINNKSKLNNNQRNDDDYKNQQMLRWLPYINNQNINWILRLKDPNRKTIPAWEDPENTVATHKLGYSTSNTSDEIYPSVVQTRSGRLLDMSNPAFGFSNRDIYEYNKRRGEILNLPKGMGEIFTTTYKNYYPGGFKYNTPNKVESINLKKEYLLPDSKQISNESTNNINPIYPKDNFIPRQDELIPLNNYTSESIDTNTKNLLSNGWNRFIKPVINIWSTLYGGKTIINSSKNLLGKQLYNIGKNTNNPTLMRRGYNIGQSGYNDIVNNINTYRTASRTNDISDALDYGINKNNSNLQSVTSSYITKKLLPLNANYKNILGGVSDIYYNIK